MPFKSNYHGLKSVDTSRATTCDGLATEILIFIVTATFAYMGYRSGFLLLFVLNLLASVGFLFAIIMNLYLAAKDKRMREKQGNPSGE